MELDNIIWIILWVFIIVFSLVSSKKNKANVNQRQKRELKALDPEIQQEPKNMPPLVGKQRPRAVLQKSIQKPFAEKFTEFQKKEDIKPQPVLPIEGERVTHKPMQTQPIDQPKEIVNEETSWLKDKESLKKALIFGQILQPKF